MDKSSSGRVTLGEQAAALQNPHDRVMALRRVTAAAQVLLARTMVMRALSLLSVRYNYTSLLYCDVTASTIRMDAVHMFTTRGHYSICLN